MKRKIGGVFTLPESLEPNWIDIARSAKRILVPKSRDALSGVAAFTAATGIEVPKNVWECEYVESDGRSFRPVPSADGPSQVAAEWADLAVCSTEHFLEARIPTVQSFRIGESVCRYSVLALEEYVEEWKQFLERTSRYPVKPRQLPASFPRLLGMIAAVRDLPLLPMLGVSISGKGEATMRDSGVGAVADRVDTGDTVRKLGGKEVFKLADIYPVMVVRRQDADAYKPSA